MQLNNLLEGLKIIEHHGNLAVDIDSVVYDSRKARQGSLFVCIEGFITDGHQYIEQALAQGVSAIMVQKPLDQLPSSLQQVAWIRLENTRIGLACVSDHFFGHPAGKLDLIGITGTKGKTTSTYMARAMLSLTGRSCGLIGTVANIVGDEINFASRTTPESYDLQALLAEMVDHGLDSCVMEVSSQGLMLDRVFGCHFRVGAFTNLYHDHIGPHEHANMDEYLQAKLMLFDRCDLAVVNRDLDCYDQVRAAVQGPCLTFGLSAAADVRAENLHKTVVDHRVGTAFDLISPWYTGEVFVGMPGRFNVYNALTAIACCGPLGIPFSAVCGGLRQVSVPGRVQPVSTGRDFQVIVDYAHNAASLEHLLQTLREYVSGRLIVMFGNGGDRSRSRRFEMGEVAGRLADLTVITSDNPRTEDPLAIIEDIMTGIRPTGGQYHVVVDRHAAIDYAIHAAGPGDMVVIAGKGHENYQIFKDHTIHFDDAETAAAILSKMGDHDHA